MLDKDGKFLLYLLIRFLGIFILLSLFYDLKMYYFWVGLIVRNIVCVYRYLSWFGYFVGMI